MKKKKMGILASALMVCAVCASLIVGSTFALFTSNDTVNIAITSGKVAVTATVGEPTVSVIEGSGMTAPNVEAKTVGNSVTLSNITPGDKVDFDIAIDNSQTTTKAKYRISYKVENGYLLASGLDIVVGEITDGTAKYQSYSSAWTEEIAKTVKVSISMPVDAGNLYQGLSTAISFSVEAIQANAVTSEAPVVSYLPDNTDAVVAAENNNFVVLEKGASLADALKDSKDKYIVLTEDTVFAGASELNNVTIDANGNELYKTTSGIKSLSGTAVTMKNAVFNPGSNDDWGISTRGVSYYNCVFNGYSPYYNAGKDVNVLDDIVVDGCTFNNTTLQICYNEHTGLLPKNTIITNNVFNVNNTNANAHAIVLAGGEKEQWENAVAEENKKEVVIEGNIFNPVYADKSYVAYYIYGQYLRDEAGNVVKVDNLTQYVQLDNEKVKTFPDNTYNGLAMYSVNTLKNQYSLTEKHVVATANGFVDLAKNIDSYKGQTITLGADIDLGSACVPLTDELVIDGNGKTLTSTGNGPLNCDHSYLLNGNKPYKAVTFRNCVFESNPKNWLASIGEANFENCTFKKSGAEGAATAALYIKPTQEIYFTNCTFDNVWLMIAFSESYGVGEEALDAAKVVLTGNTFNIGTPCYNDDGTLAYCAISATAKSKTTSAALKYLQEHLIVTGNKFVNQTGVKASAYSLGNHEADGYASFTAEDTVLKYADNTYGDNMYCSLGGANKALFEIKVG